MARQTVSISNGKGILSLVNGTYKATAVVDGYDNSTLSPQSVEIKEGVDSYAFTISAKGVLTLHVTETGEASGTQVVGAKFVRTDSSGTAQGEELVSDQDGNVKLENVPYSSTSNNEIYYKQIASDGGHTFDSTVQMVIMTASTKTVEIQNPVAPVRNFTLTDASFPNLVIKQGQIILEDN